MSGDNLCSQWVEQSAREDIIQHGNRGRATRSTNLTEKSLAYKKETLRETRRKINGRLIRKYSNIEDLLLFSSKNIIPGDEAIQLPLQDVVRCASRIKSVVEIEVEMTICSMMLTLQSFPSRGRCIVG